MLPIDAIWQQFARDVAGFITCTRCLATELRALVLHSAGRSDRQYCSTDVQDARLAACPLTAPKPEQERTQPSSHTRPANWTARQRALNLRDQWPTSPMAASRPPVPSITTISGMFAVAPSDSASLSWHAAAWAAQYWQFSFSRQ